MDDPAVDISIVICTYNNAMSLDRVLSRLAEQTFEREVAWDVLVVDNNSSDHTPDVVDRHRAIGRIAHLRRVFEARPGLTIARHRGIMETRAEWVVFVDDDCLLETHWLDNAMRFVEARPRCGAMGGQVRPLWEPGSSPLPDWVTWALACQDHGRRPCTVWGLVGAGMMVRRAALIETGWLESPLLDDRIGTKLVSGGDTEIGLRISHAGWEIWYTPDCVIDHVIPPRRTARDYLDRLCFGLGIAQVQADALVWPKGRGAFAIRFLVTACQQTGRALASWLKDRLRSRDIRPASIALHFAWGFWSGGLRLLSRPALLGAVVRGTSHSSTRNA